MARTSNAITLADRLTTLIPEAKVLELAKKHGAVERSHSSRRRRGDNQR